MILFLYLLVVVCSDGLANSLDPDPARQKVGLDLDPTV